MACPLQDRLPKQTCGTSPAFAWRMTDSLANYESFRAFEETMSRKYFLEWHWPANNIVPRCAGDKRTENPFLYRETFLLSPWGHSHLCHPWKVRRWMVNSITVSLSTLRIWTTLRLEYAEHSLSVYAWVDKAPLTCSFSYNVFIITRVVPLGNIIIQFLRIVSRCF